MGSEELELSGVEQPVVKWAKSHKWLHLKINGLGKRGFPDQFFFGYPRVLVMIEFKAPGKKPRPLQEYIHGWLRRLGWPVYVVDSKEQGIDILKRERIRALEAATLPGTGDRDDDGTSRSRLVPGPGAGED